MNRNLEQTNFHEVFRTITKLTVFRDGADIAPTPYSEDDGFDAGVLFMAREVSAAILACEPEDVTFTYDDEEDCMRLNVNGEEIDHFYK